MSAVSFLLKRIFTRTTSPYTPTDGGLVYSQIVYVLSGTHIKHFIIEPVIAQCKECDMKSLNFQTQQCTLQDAKVVI